jgi:hypothetical protein
MDELYYKKVRAAAVAGWWTILFAVLLGLIIAGSSMLTLHYKPAWVLSFWSGVTWNDFQNVILWMIVGYRLTVWAMLLIVIWLSLWAAKLKRLR